MTRGFFVVADGTKIETAIYINGSAYPSYEGVKILEALTSQSGDPYQGALHYVAENQEEVKRCWNDGSYLSWDTFLARKPAQAASIKALMSTSTAKASL